MSTCTSRSRRLAVSVSQLCAFLDSEASAELEEAEISDDAESFGESTGSDRQSQMIARHTAGTSTRFFQVTESCPEEQPDHVCTHQCLLDSDHSHPHTDLLW